jgi:hypothetical protein
MSVASNSEHLASIEETMKTWIKQMEQVKISNLKCPIVYLFI